MKIEPTTGCAIGIISGATLVVLLGGLPKKKAAHASAEAHVVPIEGNAVWTKGTFSLANGGWGPVGLIHTIDEKRGPQWVTIEHAAAGQGKHVITHTEAEEVVRALGILGAHAPHWPVELSGRHGGGGTEITIYGNVTVSGFDTRTDLQKLDDEAAFLERQAKEKRAEVDRLKTEKSDVEWAASILAKWKKRVEEAKK